MKFELSWASHNDDDEDKTIEISTIEELQALAVREEHSLIVDFRVGPAFARYPLEPSIMVYDDYVE